MKALICVVLQILVIFMLCMPVAARIYTDDMDDLSVNNIKRYYRLTRSSFSDGAEVPDKTVFTFDDISIPQAWAQYRVNNATSVTAAIYNHAGSFVSLKPDEPSSYYMGIFQPDMSFLETLGFHQALYCRQTNAVYTYWGGLKQLYINYLGEYNFSSVQTPPGELIGFSVNIYYSFGGNQFEPAQSQQQTTLQYSMNLSYPYCYEGYTASVPPSAKYVRVEINDITAIPINAGGILERPKQNFTALASVSISGENLTLGEPEPLVSEPVIRWWVDSGLAEDEESSKTSSSNKKSNPEDASFPGESSKSSSSSSSSSSKFEGTIVSSSKTPSTAAPKKISKSPDSSSQKTENAVRVLEENEIPKNESIIYEIPKSTEENRFNTMIIAYIIIVSGAILLVVLMPKRR